MKKYWLDTCVWRDFYEDRFSKFGNPLGKYAAEAFIKIIRNNDKILFSESLIKELKKDYNEKDINDIINVLFLSGVLVFVQITKEEHLEAKDLSDKRGLPYVDCLNAVQAKNNGAIVVSQDPHMVEGLKDIVSAIRPQEL